MSATARAPCLRLLPFCLPLHCVALLALLACCLAAPAAPAPVTLLAIDGAIGPANADYVVRGIAHARRDGSQAVILQVDTPGGLDMAMRSIIKAILTSPLPVIAYVAPAGARAASAGTYILYASHVAAMAPATNLGAATPVQVEAPLPGAAPGPAPARPPGKDDGKADGPAAPSDQGAMARKQLNDAAAYLRGLAQLRGRNADWAERAVRESLSLPADEALKLQVIDVVAPDVPALLARLDGRTVALAQGSVTLRTAGARVASEQPDWRARVLMVLTNPSIALMLLTIGVYGLLFEFMSPGAVAPGVIGALCLLLGLYGLQLLPINYAGLALVFTGIAFMVAEAFLPSFGVLGLGGIVAFVTGALILVDTDLPDYGMPLGVVLVMAVASLALVTATAAVALRTRRRAQRAGPQELVGSLAEVIEAGAAGGWANVHGETWRVTSAAPLRSGQTVRVLARRGARLEVEALDPASQSQGGSS